MPSMKCLGIQKREEKFLGLLLVMKRKVLIFHRDPNRTKSIHLMVNYQESTPKPSIDGKKILNPLRGSLEIVRIFFNIPNFIGSH